MRKSWTPTLVPETGDHTVYLVMDCNKGCVWREADAEATDLDTVIVDLLDGQYTNPRRVIAFNTFEGWSQDVSEDVALELRRRCDLQLAGLLSFLDEFAERHEGRERQLPLRLV